MKNSIVCLAAVSLDMWNIIIQGHIWKDKTLWREGKWTFHYWITYEFFISLELHDIILKWHEMSYFLSCPFLEWHWNLKKTNGSENWLVQRVHVFLTRAL